MGISFIDALDNLYCAWYFGDGLEIGSELFDVLSKGRLLWWLRDFDLESSCVDIVSNRARHLKGATIRYESLKLESP